MEISLGLLVFGYIVSYVLAYVILRASFYLEGGKEFWTCGNRGIVLILSLLGPITVAAGLLALGITFLQLFFDKPAKW